MIDAKELRIGNNIRHDCNDFLTVVEIKSVYNKQWVRVKYTRTDTYEQHNSLIPYEDINPIPLISNLLEKIHSIKRIGYNYYLIGEIRILTGIFGWIVNFKGHDLDIEIHSLHQLQNLYYALTGEELTINL